MSERVTGLEVGYLCAAFDMTDLSKHANHPAVLSLQEGGLLDDNCRPTPAGQCVAEETIQAFARAAVSHSLKYAQPDGKGG